MAAWLCRCGGIFQGRFKSVLLLEERALDEVGRYIHLNPVRISGLGLSKQDPQRTRGSGVRIPGRNWCPDAWRCCESFQFTGDADPLHLGPKRNEQGAAPPIRVRISEMRAVEG
ncbi:MAG: hypothetical protein KIT22_06740 [Verrucomicrobiae bacterium]|nr:hypothetical protein [Verrucomicrobiae bacterium]